MNKYLEKIATFAKIVNFKALARKPTTSKLVKNMNPSKVHDVNWKRPPETDRALKIRSQEVYDKKFNK